MSDSETDLVQRCRAGDDAAWRELVARHTRRVFGIAYRFVGRVDEAEDLTQEIFVRIYQSLDRYRDTRLFLMHNHPTTALYAEILRQLRELASLPIDVDALISRARDEDNVAGHSYESDSLPISPRDVADLGYTFAPDPRWAEIGPTLIRVIADEWERDRSDRTPLAHPAV